MSHDSGSGRWPRLIGDRSVLSYMGRPPVRVAPPRQTGMACRLGAFHPGHIRLALVLGCALLWAALVWAALAGAAADW